MIHSKRVRALIVAIVAVLGLSLLHRLETRKITEKSGGISDESQKKEPISSKLSQESNQSLSETVSEKKSDETPVLKPLATRTEVSIDLLIEKTKASLAKVEDLRKLHHDEIHSTPQIILKSASALGDIAEMTRKDSRTLSRAIEFYADCATSGEIADTIRALCLARYQHHSNHGENSLPAGEISDSIIQLARHVHF